MYLQCAANFVVAEYISQQVIWRGGTECEDTQWATLGDRHTQQSDEIWLIFHIETEPWTLILRSEKTCDFMS